MTEMIELIEKVREIQAKNDKYEYNRKKLDEYIPKIQEHLRDIERLLAEINPTVNINLRTKYDIDYDEIIAWVTETTASGNEVPSKSIKTAFPNIPDNAFIMLMSKLKEVKGLKRRKDGRRVVFYQ